MTTFFGAILAFILFFAVFFGATKLLGYASRNRKGQEDTATDEEESEYKR